MARKNDSRSVDRVRRRLLQGAGLAGLAGLAGTGLIALANTRSAAADSRSLASTARHGGGSFTPLARDSLRVSAIPAVRRPAHLGSPLATRQALLDRVLRQIDLAQGWDDGEPREHHWGAHQDLICLGGLPLQGVQPATGRDLQQRAIEVPGPETAAIGARALKHRCHVTFDCLARLDDWPGHVVDLSVIVGPDGKIVATQWKAGGAQTRRDGQAFPATTIDDVLDRFVERYGWDAVWPVAPTQIGNLAMTSAGLEPTLYQCLVRKGAELLVMTSAAESGDHTVERAARMNRCYAIGVGVTRGRGEARAAHADGAVIHDPLGQRIGHSRGETATSEGVDIAAARIPIAAFRRTRHLAQVPTSSFPPELGSYETASAQSRAATRAPFNRFST